MNRESSSNSLKRSANSGELVPAKRSAGNPPSVGSLQRELQLEIERRSRCEESVEQLRLELQLMGRLLAATREQLVASGATGAAPTTISLRTPPVGGRGHHRTGRSKADARLIQRLQEELAESKGQCRRLAQQAESQQHKAQHAGAQKQQLLALVSEMQEYLGSNRA